MNQNKLIPVLAGISPQVMRFRRALESLSTRIGRWAFPQDGRKPFSEGLLFRLLLICLISVVVTAMFHLGWFHGFQSMALDSYLLVSSPNPSGNVVIVTVTDEEFASEDFFSGVSPLNPDKLGLLLEATAAAKPKVIGVDLDTSTPTLRGQYQELVAKCRGNGWPPIVWSCDGIITELHSDGRHGVPPLELIPPLGGDQTVVAGLITLPCDADGVVRHYSRTFSIHEKYSGDEELFDSFPWAVVKEFKRESSPSNGGRAGKLHENHGDNGHSDPHELLMNFVGDRFSFDHITARTLLESHEKRDWWSERSPLRDKIVLIGGTFRQARDSYATPIGRIPGVELLAMAIETELRGGGIRSTHEGLAILVDIVFGIVFLYLNWRLMKIHPLVALLLNLILIGILALAASFFVFRAFGYWLSFAVVLVGIWIHGLLDIAAETHRQHAEMHELRRRLNGRERRFSSPDQNGVGTANAGYISQVSAVRPNDG